MVVLVLIIGFFTDPDTPYISKSAGTLRLRLNPALEFTAFTSTFS